MGDKEPVEEDDEVVSYAEPSRGVYKKLIVRNNRLVGAIVIGDGAIVPASASRRFAESTAAGRQPALELLFPAVDRDQPPPAPDQIPDTAQICDCNAVTKAQIVEAVLGGARSLQAVCDADAGRHRLRVVPAARSRRSSSSPARALPLIEADGGAAGRRAGGRDADRRRRGRHAQQDRALQEGKGRARHPRRRAAHRAGGMGGDRRGRP